MCESVQPVWLGIRDSRRYSGLQAKDSFYRDTQEALSTSNIHHTYDKTEYATIEITACGQQAAVTIKHTAYKINFSLFISVKALIEIRWLQCS